MEGLINLFNKQQNRKGGEKLKRTKESPGFDTKSNIESKRVSKLNRKAVQTKSSIAKSGAVRTERDVISKKSGSRASLFGATQTNQNLKVKLGA